MFKLCIFSSEKELYHDNVSYRLGISHHYIRPNDNFPNPLINVAFINMDFKEYSLKNLYKNQGHKINEKMFVNVFINYKNVMKGYIYDFERKVMIDKVVE